MDIEDFRRIITAFADSPADIDITKGTLLLQLRDELVEARLTMRSGDLIVDEDGQMTTASHWILNRVARLSLLAERIQTYVPRPDNFVVPAAALLDQPDVAIGLSEVESDNALEAARSVVGRRSAGSTSVLFLTSDAGEGKTTLINQLALSQARAFKDKKSDWLLVPIPLGGRTFLRFDDVVVAALVNRLRFQLFYYDAFLELVRMGALVPAFDGFEEMIIEGSSGEAISALGNLVTQLRSSGSVLVAARKAFFDYQSFRTQARLFDAIGNDSVGFARLAIHRWSEHQFVAYCGARGLTNGQEMYDAVANQLRSDHPLLTRAVLVRRLVDVAEDTEDLASLLTQIGTRPQDYFFQFVDTLIEREARDKWPDKSGDPPTPLLTVEQHHHLLSMLAQEMWYSATDTLRTDVVDAISELYCESIAKPPQITRQVRERLKQHSLLVTASPGRSLAFDHDDFRSFFLGEALERALLRRDHGEMRGFLQVASLPRGCVDQAVLGLLRQRADVSAVLAVLQQLADSEPATSFVRENVGILSLRLLSDGGIEGGALNHMHFPVDSLRGVSLTRATIQSSYFQPTSIAGANIRDCAFRECRFERLEVGEAASITAALEQCEVDSVLRTDRDQHLFDPQQIGRVLSRQGFSVSEDAQIAMPLEAAEPDEQLDVLERALRAFIRTTQVNESLFRTRLGVKANLFINEILPDLLDVGVLHEVPYLGAGQQSRFRMKAPMLAVESALAKSRGSYSAFLTFFRDNRGT